jgi:hypothetical protein
MSRDPIGYRGGINLFLYASSNPLSYVDPSGKICISCVVASSSFVTLHLALAGVSWSCPEAETPVTATGCISAILGALLAATGFFKSVAECITCLEAKCPNDPELKKYEEMLDELSETYHELKHELDELR